MVRRDPGSTCHYPRFPSRTCVRSGFAPLFGQQYSHVWFDFRGIADAPMRAAGFDYFENSRRAALAQLGYGAANPMGWRGYDENVWGWTACDGDRKSTRLNSSH